MKDAFLMAAVLSFILIAGSSSAIMKPLGAAAGVFANGSDIRVGHINVTTTACLDFCIDDWGDIAAASGANISGGGVTKQIAFWNASTTITGNANMTFEANKYGAGKHLATFGSDTLWNSVSNREYAHNFRFNESEHQIAVTFVNTGEGGSHFGIITNSSEYADFVLRHYGASYDGVNIGMDTSFPGNLYIIGRNATYKNNIIMNLTNDGNLTLQNLRSTVCDGSETDVQVQLDGKLCVPVSSEKYKKNVKNMTDDASGKLYQIKPIVYDIGDAKNQLGFSAEQVAKAFPDAVTYKRELVSTQVISMPCPEGKEDTCIGDYYLNTYKEGTEIESADYWQLLAVAWNEIIRLNSTASMLMDELCKTGGKYSWCK